LVGGEGMKIKEIDKMNLENYKADSASYGILIKKLVRILPSGVLKNELKRRKLTSFNWITNKFDEVKDGRRKKRTNP